MSKHKKTGLSDEAFRRVIERTARAPVVRTRLPALAPEALERFLELGKAVCEPAQVQALMVSCGSVERTGGLPPPAAIALGSAGMLTDRIMGVVYTALAPIAAAMKLESLDDLPAEATPEWCRALMAALAPAPPPEVAEGALAPEDEPVEVRAARSGLVIAS